MKNMIARLALRLRLSRFLNHPDAFYRLLGQAVRLKLGKISDEENRQDLERYYQGLHRPPLMKAIDFDAKSKWLDRPGGYKVAVLAWDGDDDLPTWRRRFSIWGRRFSLLARLKIRLDVLILRQGEQVPPHGHYGVVSGFY